MLNGVEQKQFYPRNPEVHPHYINYLILFVGCLFAYMCVCVCVWCVSVRVCMCVYYITGSL